MNLKQCRQIKKGPPGKPAGLEIAIASVVNVAAALRSALGGVQGGLQLGLALQADELIDDLASLEDHQRGDAVDPVVAGEALGVVDVDLAYFDGALVFGGQLLDDGGDLAARSAPGGPEVDQDRFLGLQDLGIEVGFGDFQYVACHRTSPFR